MIGNTHVDWFDEPRAVASRERSGRIDSVFIQLREGRAVRTTMPDESRLVVFFWGADDLPIGVQLLQPVDDLALFQLVTHLEPYREGAGPGAFTFAQLDRVLHQMREASASLETTIR